MKVLVTEIEREVLFNIYQHFFRVDDITFVEYADKSFSNPYCLKPFYIEENIVDLSLFLQSFDNIYYNYKHPLRKEIAYEDFASLYALIISIFKQREVGRKVSDVEYIYLTLKDKFELSLKMTSELNEGFTIDTHILLGNSKLGKMELYQDSDYGLDFVFVVEYESEGMFGKIKKRYTHWHPADIFAALDDVERFMSNDSTAFNFFKSFIKKWGKM